MPQSDQHGPKNPQAFLRQPLLAVAEMNGKLYEGIVAMNKEWTSFVNRRLKEDLGIAEQLAACTTTEDMLRTGTGYVRTAWTDYQSGLEQMTRLNSSLAQQTLSALQSHVDRAVKQGSGNDPKAGDTA